MMNVAEDIEANEIVAEILAELDAYRDGQDNEGQLLLMMQKTEWNNPKKVSFSTF